MSYATDLVEEGLAYFEKSGDAGDKEYAKAIRQHIAHLSAQAKVRVTDEDVNKAWDAFQTCSDAQGVHYDTFKGVRAALESFAARLSQGAQGEAVDGWHINPGQRPVLGAQEVQALWSDGQVIRNRAGNWSWGHTPLEPGAPVIVAYREVT